MLGVQNGSGRESGVDYRPRFQIEVFFSEDRVGNYRGDRPDPENGKRVADFDHDADTTTRGFFGTFFIRQGADGADPAGDRARVSDLGLTIESYGAREIDRQQGLGFVEIGPRNGQGEGTEKHKAAQDDRDGDEEFRTHFLHKNRESIQPSWRRCFK